MEMLVYRSSCPQKMHGSEQLANHDAIWTAQDFTGSDTPISSFIETAHQSVLLSGALLYVRSKIAVGYESVTEGRTV